MKGSQSAESYQNGKLTGFKAETSSSNATMMVAYQINLRTVHWKIHAMSRNRTRLLGRCSTTQLLRTYGVGLLRR